MILAEQCEAAASESPFPALIVMLALIAFAAWMFWLVFR